MTLYGYIRTSRRQVEGMPGSDPETQQLQLRTAGVSLENIYRDVGVFPGKRGPTRVTVGGPSTRGWARATSWWWPPWTASEGRG